MKKFLSLFFIVLLLMSTIVLSSAADDDYDIVVEINEVIVFDENSIGELTVSVHFFEIERFESCYLRMDFNKDVLQYSTAISVPTQIYRADCYPTKSGIVFFAKLGPNAIPEESYSCTSTGYLKVKNVGAHNISIDVDVKDKNGDPVEVRVKFKMPYENIVDVSEITLVDEEKLAIKKSFAYAEIGTTAKEILDLYDGNVFIKSKDDMLLDYDKKLSTGDYIATLYNGFVVDKVSFFVMYDVDCNGEATAADARLVLRAAAKLENLDTIQRYAADIDGKAGITAADARLILRKAAQLD